MYYNKKRIKGIVLLGVCLMLGVCGCGAKTTVQEEQKQESVGGKVTEAVGLEEPGVTEAVVGEAEITQPVNGEAAGITQAVTEGEKGTIGEAEPTRDEEAQPADVGKEAPADIIETQPMDAEDTEETEIGEPVDTVETETVETEKPEDMDTLKEMEPEELVLHVLTNAEGVHFTSDGVKSIELKGYVEEGDIAYFIMRTQNSFGRTHEAVHIGILNPETGELLQHQGYGNTTSDAVMIENETGRYILYATECTDFGFYSGRGGVLLAKDGTLTPVWPLTPEGVYDDSYWTLHTAKLNGEVLEIYKVIITDVRPDGIANEMITELEQTLTLDEILAGAV